MSEVKKCPKCNSKMIRVKRLAAVPQHPVYLYNGFLSSLGNVIPFCCPNCGYIELYNEENLKNKLSKAQVQLSTNNVQ